MERINKSLLEAKRAKILRLASLAMTVAQKRFKLQNFRRRKSPCAYVYAAAAEL